MNEYKWYSDDFEKDIKTGEYNIVSTSLVPYTTPKKKQKTWKVAIASALVASVLCTGIFSTIMYSNGLFAKKPNINYVTQATDTPKNKDTAGTSNTLGRVKMEIPEIADKVGPSVVGVINQAQYSGFINQTVDVGSGSGIIIRSDGYILTNQHVINGASDITIILNTQKQYKAKVVGSDTKTDLAILKIEETNLPAATLGDSTKVKVGELAVAIGNPLGQELAGSVTAGVISAVNRTIQLENKQLTLIQTDASINPGNSGGALVNAYGEVIGINTVKMSASGVEGIGFSIPTSEARPIIDQLMQNGYVSGRPVIGIAAADTNYGVLVQQIVKGGAADVAGIKSGDLIVKANGKPVKTVSELNKIKDTLKPGNTIVLTVFRDQAMTEVNVVLKEDKPSN